MEIRNIAIIAHVDHGKTTITDAILRQTGTVSDENASMDSNALEKERGITIYSKNTSVFYKETKINIVDTPGHADFGSEVERVLRSIDSVILVVDAQEGPMPQTRFVLKKSLELGLKPIVLINKIDKPAADPDVTQEKVFELFLDLGATDEQLDFAVVYAIGKQGIAKKHLDDDSKDLMPLLDTILEKVDASSGDPEAELLAQPFNLGYDNFLGRLAIVRIYEGKITSGQKLIAKKTNGENKTGKVTKLYTFRGTERKEVQEALAGDIVMVAGFPSIEIGETLCENENQEAVNEISVDEPTITLQFLVNDSPFAGREGKFVTGQQIRERLKKELEINVGLKVSGIGESISDGDFSKNYFEVSGRGELHIAILLENMRREGYEVQVSQPQVIIKFIDGVKFEPFEEVTIDVPAEMSGGIIETLGKRKSVMIDMSPHGSQTRIVFVAPTRALFGYRGQFIMDTKGEGIFCTRVIGFRPFVGEIKRKKVGSMTSMASGKALGFSLANLQERGTLYVGPGTEVYEGMVIGNAIKGDDMTVNPTKGKQMSNMRSSGADEAIHIVPPINLNIERGLEFMNEDEYLEITPESVRLRKKYLTENERIKAKRKK
jgi:GTP-binding protein